MCVSFPFSTQLDREIPRPLDYANVHFFPASYATLATLSPRATWRPVDTAAASPGLFAECLEEVTGGVARG